jgi:hypothetical protein
MVMNLAIRISSLTAGLTAAGDGPREANAGRQPPPGRLAGMNGKTRHESFRGADFDGKLGPRPATLKGSPSSGPS